LYGASKKHKQVEIGLFDQALAFLMIILLMLAEIQGAISLFF
jgi:hypothetical protein